MSKGDFETLYKIYEHFDLSPFLVKENLSELMFTEDSQTDYERVATKSKTAFSKFFLTKMGDNGVIKL